MNPIFANRMKQGLKTAGVAFLGAALLVGCSAAPVEQTDATQSTVKSVKVAPIEKKSIGEPAEQVADVASSVQIDVVTKASGDVLSILKKRGDRVEQGEVLFRLDPTDVLIAKEKAQIAISSTREQMVKGRQDLESSKLELRNGIAKLEISINDTEKTFNKLRNDYDMGLATKIQVEQMESQLQSMRLDLESTRSKLASLENTNSLAQLEQALQTAEVTVRETDRTLEHMEVKAAVSGILTDLPIEIGTFLPAGTQAAKLQQIDPITIKAELSESAAALVRGKQELTFYVPGTTDKLQGKVIYLADVMSANSKSYSLELEAPNPNHVLKPGMKAQVLLAEAEDQIVVVIPSLSVVREGSDTFVFILNGDKVEKRKVQLGRLNGTDQEALSGVKEGEQLVVSGQHQLKDQEVVQLTQ